MWTAQLIQFRHIVTNSLFHLRRRLAPEARELYAETHREVDRLLLTLVLEYTDGSQHQAARLLGIARQTLRLKLRELGLHVTHAVEPDDDND